MRDLLQLRQNRTDVRTEVVDGVTTFVTLSYIVFVQPTVLAACLHRRAQDGGPLAGGPRLCS